MSPQTLMAPAPTKTRARAWKIRRARPRDMDLVAGFISSSAEWYRPFVAEDDMAEHEVGRDWAERNFPIRDFYVGEAKGTPVGTISLQYFGDYAYLGYIYLDTDHTGQGYGRKLIDFAEDQARLMGMKGLCLIAHPKATWATKAYRRRGFERIASAREDVVSWNGGVLEPFYEDGFELYVYDFED